MRWITEASEPMRQYRAQIARGLPMDGRNPPTRGFFEARAADGSGTGETLASKVSEWIRHALVLRVKYGQLPEENHKENSDAVAYFVTSPHSERMRFERNDTDLLQRGANSGFHVDTHGTENIQRTASMRFHYFHKVAQELVTRYGEVRAYVVLKPKEAKNVAKHFQEIAARLFNQGIPFEGKAGTPGLVRIRKDHMVFWIPKIHQDEARPILEKYLNDHAIGSEETLVGEKGRATGLWWAPSPDSEEERIGDKITGKTWGTYSHNKMAALALSADFMQRLAEAHRQNGNAIEADAFESEARRVQRILEHG